MSARLPAIGFWSYARHDDESGQQLTQLRGSLAKQVQMRYGREPVKIFQDVAAIPPGAEWETQIREALNRSTFFVPIITPNFVQSQWCATEFRVFRERELDLERQYPFTRGRRRIFPVYYVDIEGIDPVDPQLVPELRRLQWLDFRDLIFAEQSNQSVQTAISELARSIRDLLLARLEAPKPSEDILVRRSEPSGAAPAQQFPSDTSQTGYRDSRPVTGSSLTAPGGAAHEPRSAAARQAPVNAQGAVAPSAPNSQAARALLLGGGVLGALAVITALVLAGAGGSADNAPASAAAPLPDNASEMASAPATDQIDVANIAPAQAIPAAPVGKQAPAPTDLRFDYDYASGAFVRRASGSVQDWRGFQAALAQLQPPPGARGGYGLLGDDNLLGQEPGYGLRQLGALARRYVSFSSLYVVQPAGFEQAGVQAGTFTDVSQLNDATLGWVLFDLRGKFEADLAKMPS